MVEESLSIQIRQIKPGDSLTGLSLGDPKYTALKTFLQKHAQKYEAQSLSRTYGAFREDNAKIIGYVTLVCGEVVTDGEGENLVHEPGLKYLYDHYPAIKIARLAVDKRYAKGGLGKYLVNLGLGIAKRNVCPSVGCRFAVVDSKKDAVSFYERCGFTLLDTPTNRARDEPVMFIDLNKVAAP